MSSLNYIFEGEAPVKCSKCGFPHTIYFSGVSPTTVKQAIHEALEVELWRVSDMTCPECFDPLADWIGMEYTEEEPDGALEDESEDDWD